MGVRRVPVLLLSLVVATSLVVSLALTSLSAKEASRPSARGATAAYQGPLTENAARAGVSVVDATFHVGVSAGQYASTQDSDADEPVHNLDPYGQQTKNVPSYGIQSRLSARAIVVEGEDPLTDERTRVALVKNDLYIPQDLLNTRVAGILEEYDAQVALGACPVTGPTPSKVPEGGCQPTGIDHSNLVIGVSHNHTSPYYSSPSWGVMLFQDAFDVRFFEYLANQMALAVINASNEMVPVRMGAATGFFDDTQKHSFGPSIADDGTPAGYPQTDGDLSLSVVRFDDVSDPADPKPLANFVTLGEHPEFLEGNNLISGDYISSMERMSEAATGAPTVFVQNNTGTAEDDSDCKAHACSERREFGHREYAQAERGGRFMADAIVRTWSDIARCSIELTEPGECSDRAERLPSYDKKVVPFETDFVVGVNDKQFAPPYSHPYPSVSNCRTHEAFNGNPGVPIAGVPDCERIDDESDGFFRDVVEQIPPPFNPGFTYNELKKAGIPLPDNYGAPSYGGLQETFQVHLQAVRLGGVGITVCPCEQWSDQSRNIKTRLDKTPDNQWVGFDWSTICSHDPATGKWSCPGGRDGHSGQPLNEDGTPIEPVTAGEWERMVAQVRNDARGWDAGFEACEPQLVNDGQCPLRAETDPADPDLIKGNFTQTPFTPAEHEGEPFPAEPTQQGYDLVLPVGMANDYWGYIASYREYQRGDHYRKALTGLGAHSSDFLATRLVTMAANLNGGPDYPYNALDTAYMVDGAHQFARAEVIGNDGKAYTAAYDRQKPRDGGVPHIVSHPQPIERFDVTNLVWVGGSNYQDDPQVRVERRLPDGTWTLAGDMTGEVVATVDYPKNDTELAAWRAGLYRWRWTASWEAFDSDIDTGRGNQTPTGTYRFRVNGLHHEGAGVETPYALTSNPFQVSPWDGITVPDMSYSPGQLDFSVGPVRTKDFYPKYPFRRCVRDGAECLDRVRSISVGPIDYPDTWAPLKLPQGQPETGDILFPRLERTYISCVDVGRCFTVDPEEPELYCFSCTFRPWVDTGTSASAEVTVYREDGTVELIPAVKQPSQGTGADGLKDRWSAPLNLAPGDVAFVNKKGVKDTFGEINGACYGPITTDNPAPTSTRMAACPTVQGGGAGALQVTIRASKPRTSYMESTRFSGEVIPEPGCTGPYSVKIRKRRHDGNTFKYARSVKVAADNTWRFVRRSKVNADYSATVEPTNCTGDTSDATTVLVKAHVKVKEVGCGRHTSYVAGRVRPDHKGTDVVLRRRRDERWRTAARDVLDGESRFRLEMPSCKGRYRVVWPEQGSLNLRGWAPVPIPPKPQF